MAKKTITTEKKDGAAGSKIILAPHITEKASSQSMANAYTFVVAKNATKHSVAGEIKKQYKVTPLAINITNMPTRNTFIRGKFGYQAGIKKAIVFLKKGDTIALS
jgi:large subunit ribosomal protein L23